MSGVAAREADLPLGLCFEVLCCLVEVEFVCAGKTGSAWEVEGDATADLLLEVRFAFDANSEVEVGDEVGGSELGENESGAVVVDAADDQVDVGEFCQRGGTAKCACALDACSSCTGPARAGAP